MPNTTFNYRTAPKTGGGSSTRAVLGEQVEESAITAAAAAAAGITPAQAEAAIKSLLEQLLTAAACSQWSDGLYGLIGFRPTSGGSKEDPNQFVTPDDINANVAISFLAAKIAEWRAVLSIQSMGGVGKVTPMIEHIFNEANDNENEYTVGQNIRLVGDNLRLDKTDLTQGVFFRLADNSEVRATGYAGNEPGTLYVIVPTGVTGSVTVRIAAFINGSVRSYTFTDPITASV